VFAISGDDGNRAASYPGLKYSRIVFGDGSGQWSDARVVELPTNRWSYNTYAIDIQVIDYDGDGDNDILTPRSYNSTPDGPGAIWLGQFIQVLRNDDGRFVDATAEAMFAQGLDQTAVNNPFVLQMPDLNGDGAPDIVLLNRDTWLFDASKQNRQSVMVALNDGKGHFQRVDPRQWGAGAHTGHYLGAADFDGDGDVDIAGYEEIGVGDEADWMIKGFTVTIYDNKGAAVHPPLPFLAAKYPMQMAISEIETQDDGTLVVPIYAEFSKDLGLGITELEFLLIGQYGVPFKNFIELEILLVKPVKGAVAQAVEACPRMRTEDWGDGTRIVFRLNRALNRFTSQGADCAIEALDAQHAAEASFIFDNFADIATNIVIGGVAQGLTPPELSEFFERAAKEEITLVR
jgi:hypothetical protein